MAPQPLRGGLPHGPQRLSTITGQRSLLVTSAGSALLTPFANRPKPPTADRTPPATLHLDATHNVPRPATLPRLATLLRPATPPLSRNSHRLPVNAQPRQHVLRTLIARERCRRRSLSKRRRQLLFKPQASTGTAHACARILNDKPDKQHEERLLETPPAPPLRSRPKPPKTLRWTSCTGDGAPASRVPAGQCGPPKAAAPAAARHFGHWQKSRHLRPGRQEARHAGRRRYRW
jgi:hypothetical protein